MKLAFCIAFTAIVNLFFTCKSFGQKDTLVPQPPVETGLTDTISKPLDSLDVYDMTLEHTTVFMRLCPGHRGKLW